MNHSFFAQVYEIVGRIPEGKVASYGQIACMIGSPSNARIVGWAMRKCPSGLPWHRVIRSDGSLANKEFHELQRVMLESEGIPFLPDGTIAMKSYQWNPGFQD